MQERKTTVIGVFNAIGGLSGLLSISLLVWNGGKLVAKVDNHEERISRVETSGSVGLQKHEALDDQRVSDMRLRLNRLEDESVAIHNTLSDIRGDLREIKAYMGIFPGGTNGHNNNKKP